MKAIAKILYKLFEDHDGVYNNAHGVEFILHPDNSFTISCPWPHFKCEDFMIFELFYESARFAGFLHDFAPYLRTGINSINPYTLLKYYYDGIGKVFCAVDVRTIHYPLYFKRNKEKLFVTDDAGKEHEATGLPEKPLKFIEYTQSHFYLATAY